MGGWEGRSIWREGEKLARGGRRNERNRNHQFVGRKEGKERKEEGTGVGLRVSD